MEKSLNRVELKGNVGQDPKIVKMEGGGSVVRFSLATHETFKTKGGELKEETTWHNIVAWSAKGMPDFEKIKRGTFIELIGKIRNYLKRVGVEEGLTVDGGATEEAVIEHSFDDLGVF